MSEQVSPTSRATGLGDVDAVLLVGFGGPEAPDEIVPFLEVVTAGSGIPRERLATVGEHYHLFGGRSPINDQCRELRAALAGELERRGHAWPVLWGNRNWHPFIADTLREAHDRGLTRLVVVTTSAYPSYSGCRSYREALAKAAGQVGEFEFRRVGNYALDDAYVDVCAQAVSAALARLPGARVVFVTHSIPTAMNEASGLAAALPEPSPEGDIDDGAQRGGSEGGRPPSVTGGAYVDWHADVAERVCRRLGVDSHDLVFCSRSGPPQQQWLEPDVNDHLEALSESGVTAVVLAPIGFVSDHMEVIYDLDTQARETCDRVGIAMVRAATVGTAPRFVAGLADRVELAAARQAGAPVPGCGGAMECCRNLRAPGTEAVD